MKRPRLMRIATWGLTTVTSLLGAAWIVSLWFAVRWEAIGPHHAYGVSVEFGGVWVFEVWPGLPVKTINQGSFAPPWWEFETLPKESRLKPYWLPKWPPLSSGDAVTPLWIPFAVGLVSSAALWRVHLVPKRRLRVGACPGCGYNRAGLVADAKCPECATAPTPAPK